MNAPLLRWAVSFQIQNPNSKIQIVINANTPLLRMQQPI